MGRSPPTPPAAVPLLARELTPRRWTDFERLFRKYHGVQAGCWCMFYHREGPNGPLGSVARQEANRRDHRALLREGRAHGILVYADGRPIGWCQFGLRGELPRIEQGRTYRALAPALSEPARWRITCFFVDRPYRRSGVARFALRAALDAIGRHGGGLVEAYPATHGHAVALWFGTLGMYEGEGFETVRPFGRSNVLVRRRVPGRIGTLPAAAAAPPAPGGTAASRPRPRTPGRAQSARAHRDRRRPGPTDGGPPE
jgi:GNAT superfamily N-acetyltransferase